MARDESRRAQSLLSQVSDRVVDHDEGDEGCHGMTGEVERAPVNAVVGGHCGLVHEGAKHIERKFCLWYEFVPKVDGEQRMCAGKYCDDMPLEGLCSSLCLLDRLLRGEHTGR
jgi:hypothetical protein